MGQNILVWIYQGKQKSLPDFLARRSLDDIQWQIVYMQPLTGDFFCA